ncbi:MAG: hypothetical protein CR982_09015 [Candidatus Cloacimonadota bacterium]|nr:MAG: hypothetical protein CR982_09015 [Candidatus Cloacimonadota bacterium]PIE78606.1 MAG: hypothetical protein CSA15_06910 [Candidatus Delongbacteria bacterium]
MISGNEKKGSVLAVAIMIVLIMFILVSGSFIISKNGVYRTNYATDDYDLYWSAHAGWVRGFAGMNDIALNQFLTTDKDTLSWIPGDESLKDINNGTSVEYSVVREDSGFKIVSTARKNGRFVTIKNSGIKPQCMLKYAECITNTHFDYVWDTSRNFYGDIYAECPIYIQESPLFYGDVVSATDSKSFFGTPGWDSNPPAPEFNMGIVDNFNRKSSIPSHMYDIPGFDPKNYNPIDGFTTLFKKDYKSNSPRFWGNFTKGWFLIHNKLYKEYTENISDAGKEKRMHIETEGEVTIELKKDAEGLQTADITHLNTSTGNDTTYKNVPLSNVDIITIDNGRRHAKVKGEVCSELSIVTKSSSIEIIGDIYLL